MTDFAGDISRGLRDWFSEVLAEDVKARIITRKQADAMIAARDFPEGPTLIQRQSALRDQLHEAHDRYRVDHDKARFGAVLVEAIDAWGSTNTVARMLGVSWSFVDSMVRAYEGPTR